MQVKYENLVPNIKHVHKFHISQLKKYVSDPIYVIIIEPT